MTRDDIRALHTKYAAGELKDLYYDLVWTHSVIVSEIALQIADRISFVELDLGLIEQGALVHDIGMYRCYDEELNPSSNLPGLQHGFEGAKILKEEGISYNLQRFCLTHIATGLTAEDVEREKLAGKVQDYLPITMEEEIVCYADKFHSKHPSFSNIDSIARRISKFDPDRGIRLDTLRRKYGLPEIAQLESKYAKWSKDIDIKINAAVAANP